jgi:hypothetical protein
MLAAAVTAAALAPIRFEQRRGWRSGAGVVRACPGVPAIRCREVRSWAATVRLRDCLWCLPHRTFAHMPAGGIVIQLSVALEHPPVASRRTGWPLRVDRGRVGGLEGVPARIGVYQIFARVDERGVYAFVFFGRSRPSAPQLAAANAELRAAKLP